MGHVITPGKLGVAQKTVDAVKYFKLPETQTHIKSFLGLCNVYRRFVPNFARVAKPLNNLLKKGNPSKLQPLNEEEINAFNTLKNALISPPILKLPRKNLPYSLDTDACGYQIGVALMQTYEDNTRHPIGYWSRSLNKAEQNYTVTEQECLAVVWACQILRPYLEGAPFTIYTDHQALKWLLGLTDTSGRLARWRLRLSEFDLSIEYKKGKKNTIADAISRLPTDGETTVDPDLEIPTLLIEDLDCDYQTICNKYTIEDILDDFDEYDEVTAQSSEATIFSLENNNNFTALSEEEILREQYADKNINNLRLKLEKEKVTPFSINDKGLSPGYLPRTYPRKYMYRKNYGSVYYF